MQVTVLGSGAAYPRPGGACSGFLVEGGGVRVWLDAGNGTFSRLLGRMSYADLDAVVLSHAHADHIADIPPLMYACGYDESFQGAIPVYAPSNVPEVVSAPFGDGSMEIFERVFSWRRIEVPFEIGGLRFEPFQTVHPVETYGMRIREGDRCFVYTADTADFPELAGACRGADLLLCEATFVGATQAPPGLHLWAREAGAVAAKADVGRLLLTHVWPTHPLEQAVEEASAAYRGPADAAEEGGSYAV